MDTNVTIAEFKLHLKAAGYAPATIDSYAKNLDHFRRYLQSRDISDMRTISRQVIADFQAAVNVEPNAMETKALKIRCVKRLFEHLVASHKLLINPTDGVVETCRVNRKIGVTLTIDEVKRLLDQPNLSLPLQIRDRAVLEVFYSTGIRLNELLHLEIYHADLRDKVLYIRKGKGNRQRVVPLGKSAVRYLGEYLHKIRPLYARKNRKERRLFLCQDGRPMTPGAVRTNLREYRIRAGIKKPVSPHTLRRTCATHMLEQGADIRYIQKLLGHKELKTTQMYTKLAPVDIKKTHRDTHPGYAKVKGEKTP